MFDFKRFALTRFLLVALVLLALAFSGCLGPRGWPGVAGTGDTLFVGSMGGAVFALNSEGARLWSWAPEEEASGGLFGCGCSGAGGQFRAGMLYGAPVVGNATVYVAVYDGRVFALDAATGEQIQEYDTESTIVGGLAVAGDSLFVGASDGNLYGFDLNTAGLRPGFPFGTEDKIWSTPTVQDGTVYFGSLDHKLYAVDADTGELEWDQAFETGGAIASRPLVVNGVVYVGSFDSNFYAVDAETGSEIWVFDQARKWFWAEALYDRGVIYACSLDHSVYAIDAANGELAWASPFDAGDEIKSSPVLVGDVLVVATEEGSVYGVDVLSGEEKWHSDLETKVLSRLFAHEGKVYVNGQDSRLYTFDGATGVQGWSVILAE